MRLAILNAQYPFDDDVDSIVFSYDSGILYTGREHGVRKFQPLTTIDADQQIVIPGLTDAHTHLYSTALTLGRLDLRGVKSIEELKEKVREAYRGQRPGEWIVGRGWDQDKMREKRFPKREELDEVAPDVPVVLVRVCGHAAVLNTKAMEMLGLLEKREETAKFIQIEDGRPTGLIFEDLVDYALSQVPPPPMPRVEEMVKSLLEEYLSYGVVELHSMSVSESELDIISRLAKMGEFIQEYKAYIGYEEFLNGIHLRHLELVRGVKLFADGSFGARTAALREPYSDADTKGQLLLKSQEILTLASKMVSENLEVAVHAIGDRAVEEVLVAAQRIGDRIRIEHASLTPLDILENIAQLTPRISVQPHFILSDTWIAERLGERARWVYAFRSLTSTGARLLGSSDSPVEPLNPWLGIYAAVNRGLAEGLPIYAYTWSESLSLRRAILLYSEHTSKKTSLVVTNVRRTPSSLEDYRRIKARVVITRKGVRRFE